MSDDTIRIPRSFYDDHISRDLPAPPVIRSTNRHYHIGADDSPALWELLEDARHYATPGLFAHDPGLFGLVMSARATLRAITALLETEEA